METEIKTPIDPETKRAAESVFRGLGLTPSQAITLFFEEVRRLGTLPPQIPHRPEDIPVKPR